MNDFNSACTCGVKAPPGVKIKKYKCILGRSSLLKIPQSAPPTTIPFPATSLNAFEIPSHAPEIPHSIPHISKIPLREESINTKIIAIHYEPLFCKITNTPTPP